MMRKTIEDANHKIEGLFDFASTLSQQNDFQETLRLVSSQTKTICNADITSIMMINPKTENTIKTIMKDGTESDQNKHQFVQTNIIGFVAGEQKPILSTDIRKDNRFSHNLFKGSSIQSVMCVALKNIDKPIGFLVAMNKEGSRQFDSGSLELLQKLSTISAPFLSNVQKINEYFSPPLPENALLKKYEHLGLLGQSTRYIELVKAIEAAARCDVRVLLEGQSGTGKELIAKAIHKLSSRKDHHFVAIDCGAISSNLIESELFGHVKGAFTGATQDRKGLFEEAHRGTLFMDEISNLPLDMQVKLLRVLQEEEIRILGSNKTRKVDVRVIAASSDSLRVLLDNGQFREDLFYRLNVYPIDVPSLNEREEDILLLAEYFLKKYSHQQKKKVQSIHHSLLNFMEQKKWKGNIRELENLIERVVTLIPPDNVCIDIDILPQDIHEEYTSYKSRHRNHGPHKSLQESIEELEATLIQQALIDKNWNQTRAAKALKISEHTIRYKMQKLGIRKPS
jgi:transcriptional regulator with GAF, ATPase, and Fis domain